MKQEPAPNHELVAPDLPFQENSEKVTPAAALEELERILASPAFTQAQRLSRFLRFTVEQVLHGGGDSLKEYHLGIAVFDKDESFDTRTDPIVRVEAGRLRTRLKEYYASEGREDLILIDLPKGSYAPVISVRRKDIAARDIPEVHSLPGTNRWKMASVLLALLAAAFLILWGTSEYRLSRVLSLQRESASQQLPLPELLPIWRPFIAPGSKNFAVFGSPIFFASPQYNLFVRPHQINEAANLTTDRQLLSLQERFGPLAGPRYDYTLMGDAIALHRLTAFMIGYGASLTAMAAHEAVWDSIKDGNIIFLGAPRMNPLMRHLPVQQDFEWDADQNVRNRNPQPGEQEVYSTPSHENVVSYAVVAALPGLRPDREILVLAAHGGPGTQAAVDYLTRIETVRTINQKLKLSDTGERKHYQMLLRVFVDKGAPVKTEYITHHMIP
jgi:hypothetical protein